MGETAPQNATAAAEWLPIGKFAKTYGFDPKSVSRWVRLGMPHFGKGHNCRIHVAKARAWLSDDGPRKAKLRLGQLAHARSLQ